MMPSALGVGAACAESAATRAAHSRPGERSSTPISRSFAPWNTGVFA
jgi:hypothetical protein